MILSREDDFRFPVNDKIIICDKKIKTKKRRGYCCRYAALPSPLAAIGHLAVFLLLYTHVRCCRWVYCANLSHLHPCHWVFSCVFVVVHPSQILLLGLFDDLSRLHPCHWVFCYVLLLYTHVRCWQWVYCDNLSHLYPHHWAYCCILVFIYPYRSLSQELAGKFCS